MPNPIRLLAPVSRRQPSRRHDSLPSNKSPQVAFHPKRARIGSPASSARRTRRGSSERHATRNTRSRRWRHPKGPRIDDSIRPGVLSGLELFGEVVHGRPTVEVKHEGDVLEDDPGRPAN